MGRHSVVQTVDKYLEKCQRRIHTWHMQSKQEKFSCTSDPSSLRQFRPHANSSGSLDSLGNKMTITLPINLKKKIRGHQRDDDGVHT